SGARIEHHESSAIGNPRGSQQRPRLFFFIGRRLNSYGGRSHFRGDSLRQFQIVVHLMLLSVAVVQAIRQEPTPPVSRIPYALGHAPEKHHRGGFKRVREKHREIELPLTDSSGQPHPLFKAGRQWLGPNSIDEGRGCEQSCYPWSHEQGDLGFGKLGANG